MKKIILSAVMLAAMTTVASADDMKTFGTVAMVSDSTFTVTGDDGQKYLFNVNEATEMERNGSGWFDDDIEITDLNTGDRVEVEYVATNPNYLVVEEVEVFPAKK